MPEQRNDVNFVIDSIKQEVKELTKRENLLNEGQGFVLWILRNYFDLDPETSNQCLIDGPNDKKIDGFIEEDDSIKIIQCKFGENINKEVGGNEIAGFKGCIDWLLKPEAIEQLNKPRLLEAARTFKERWNEEINIELHFFVFGKFSHDAQQERNIFNQSDLTKEKVEMIFHDIDDIIKVYRVKLNMENPLANEEFTIELISEEYYLKRGNMSSIVATINAKDLITMYSKYGNALFERNIRYYRGARRGSINARIIDTCLDKGERQKFWYYNNGISFVCRDFTLDNSSNPPLLKVQGFQVINGCQTTVCLFESSQRAGTTDFLNDIQLIVRFIKAPVDEVDFITLYTNSQNPVSEIQLKSNDPIQKKLKNDLANYNPPYFYSIKEGDWQILSPEDKEKFDDRIIRMSDVAQAIYSFTTDPAFARRWQKKLFSEKYSSIFKKDITVEEIILPWRVLKIIDKQISEYRVKEFNRLNKNPDSFSPEQKDEIKRKEFLIYSNLIMLYFIGQLIKKRYDVYNAKIAKNLLNNKLEERIVSLFNYVVSILQYSQALKQETNLPRFLKNFDNINTIFDEIQRAIASDQARTKKDPLEDILPVIT